jgi:hypothetical protein
MDVVDKSLNDLSIKRIELQKSFAEYNEKNGFSYELWVTPPSGHFYETYKDALQQIDFKMAPPLQYQT